MRPCSPWPHMLADWRLVPLLLLLGLLPGGCSTSTGATRTGDDGGTTPATDQGGADAADLTGGLEPSDGGDGHDRDDATPDGAARDGGTTPLVLPSAVFNFRHVSGLTTATGQRLRPGVLFRSGHLAELDSTGCTELQALHLATIVDLRSAAEVAGQPDAACATASVRYLVGDLPKLLPPTPENYAATLDAAEPRLAAIFEAVARPEGLPVLVHCVIGRDRANLINALLLATLQIPEAQILDDFVTNQGVAVEAAWLAPLFTRLTAAGGVEAYLAQHEVDPAAIDRLRAMALQ